MISTSKSGKEESMLFDTTGIEMHPVKVLGDYREQGGSGFVDLGNFSAEETKKFTELGIEDVNSKYDGWKNTCLKDPTYIPLCSSCIKKLDDGLVIMGRNMDLPSSYSPAFIFRTTGDGINTYDTVNLAYSNFSPITFDQMALERGYPKNSVPGQILVCSDTLNSEGLYLQYNMRESQDCPSSSTNPNGEFRTSCMTLGRLVGDHCATIDEALEYIKSIDIYDPKSTAFDWSMAIGMMDKTGRYGVCEFVNNRIVWNEGRPGFACGQCNFYWDKEGFKTGWGAGFGRWQKLMEHYNDINNLDDMEKVIHLIWYSGFLADGATVKDWKVNWMSEMSEKTHFSIREKWLRLVELWHEQYGINVDKKELMYVRELAEKQEANDIRWNNDYLNDPVNYYDVIAVTNLFIKSFRQLPVEVKKLSGFMEVSTFSYVAENKELGYRLHLFETNDVYHVGIYETTIDRIPSPKIIGEKE